MGPPSDTRRDQFMRKYPDADMSKFYFDTVTLNSGGDVDTEVYFVTSDDENIDIMSEQFLDNPNYTKYLTTKPKPKPFPKIWLSNGSVQDLPKGHSHYIKQYDGKIVDKYYDGYPSRIVLDYLISNFKVFVNGRDYFMSKLPIINIATSRNKAEWDDSEMYYMVLFSVYCASYCCGVSMQHLTPKDAVNPMITSIMRFHLYFTVMRLITRMNAGESMSSISREFGASRIYKQIKKVPRDHHYQGYVLKDGSTGEKIVYQLHDPSSDYKRYVPQKSDGFTKIGLEYLNQSIEAYVYAILGSQAKTRVSIVNRTAGSLETQSVFRQLVHDGIVNYDTSTWIYNMNKSIGDTNVTQNMAISPSLWLIPSRMIILKNPIIGYNNLLKTASKDMVFGVNYDINYAKPIETHQMGTDHQKKVHDDSSVFMEDPASGVKPGHASPPSVRPPSRVYHQVSSHLAVNKQDKALSTGPNISGMVMMGVGTVIGGFVVSRYVL